MKIGTAKNGHTLCVENLEKSINFINKKNENYDVYEFGVFKGTTLLYIYELLEKDNIKYNNIVGFDSFEGFPSFEIEYKKDPNTYKEWGKMNFSLIDEKDTIIKEINSFFEKKPILIPGFFENSLKDDIVNIFNFKPASFVHIDCDLYTSTYTALDFLFRNNLIVKDTIITYDEWGPLFKKGEPFGEHRAHLEISKKYGDFELLCTIDDKAIFRKK